MTDLAAPAEAPPTNLANYASDWSLVEYTREQGLRPVEAAIVAAHFPPPPARVLDLGCGAGRTTGELAARGYQVVAIDLAPRLLEAARARYPGLDFREMDATALDFPAASFDAALFSYNGIDCIYPESARVACQREVFRVLRPGGAFALSSHNWLGALWSGGFFYLTGYWNALKFHWNQRGNRLAREGFLRYDDGGGTQYLYSRTPEYTVRQLKAAGFREVTLYGHRPGQSPGFIRRHVQHVHFVATKPGAP